MTEQEWLASGDAAAMLELLTRGYVADPSPGTSLVTGPRISERKLRLLHEAWESPLCGDERHCLGAMSSGTALWDCLAALTNITPRYRPAAAILLKEIAGNPWRPARVCQSRANADDAAKRGDVWLWSGWLTPTAITLARAAYEGRREDGTLDPLRLAVLADALEEAGCADADLLGHLRSPAVHVRGCWAIDLMLGLS